MGPTVWRYASFSFYLSQLASETRSLGSDRNIIVGPIVNLDDYSLLNIFYLYRLGCLERDDDKAYISESISEGGCWAREHWWCTLVCVCRTWRSIIFRSPSYLRLCIVFTSGIPVAVMLAHPPFFKLQLLLVIEYIHKGPNSRIPPEDKQEIVLALQHRCRVRRIRLHAPYSGTVFRALDGEFLILECSGCVGTFKPISPPKTAHTITVLECIITALQHGDCVSPHPLEGQHSHRLDLTRATNIQPW